MPMRMHTKFLKAYLLVTVCCYLLVASAYNKTFYVFWMINLILNEPLVIGIFVSICQLKGIILVRSGGVKSVGFITRQFEFIN